MNPSSSRLTMIGTWPISVITARARASVAASVHGAPQSSTTGTRCGGLTGCATRQRARPASVSVKRDAGIADVELATIAAFGVARRARCRDVRAGFLEHELYVVAAEDRENRIARRADRVTLEAEDGLVPGGGLRDARDAEDGNGRVEKGGIFLHRFSSMGRQGTGSCSF